MRPVVKYHLRRGVGLIKFLENGTRPQPPTSPPVVSPRVAPRVCRSLFNYFLVSLVKCMSHLPRHVYAPVVSPRVATKSARVGSRNAPTAAVTASIAFSIQNRHIYVTNETCTHDQSWCAWDHVTQLPQQLRRALRFLCICKETCIYT